MKRLKKDIVIICRDLETKCELPCPTDGKIREVATPTRTSLIAPALPARSFLLTPFTGLVAGPVRAGGSGIAEGVDLMTHEICGRRFESRLNQII